MRWWDVAASRGVTPTCSAEDTSRGLSQCPVRDIRTERAKAFTEEFGVPYYEDIDDMLRREGHDIDVIAVLTLNGLHAEHVVRIAR